MMQPFEKALPFHTTDAYGGFAEVHGILHIERDYLILEFEVKDGLIGALKSSTKQLKITYLELAKLTYSRNIFRSRLAIKVNSISILSRFPGAKDGMILLKIKRNYKTEAEDIETYVNMRIAELGLEQLED